MVLLGVLRGEPARLHLDRVDGAGWTALAYLVVFGSLLAYTAYSYLLANAPISLVGTYAYVNPAVAVFLGWLILSESLTWQILLGGAVIIVGVALVVTSERRRK
jgi:drug/metabolite transporter (DMT)-like permease